MEAGTPGEGPPASGPSASGGKVSPRRSPVPPEPWRVDAAALAVENGVLREQNAVLVDKLEALSLELARLKRQLIGPKPDRRRVEDDAQAAATLLSLIGSCRLHGIDPWGYRPGYSPTRADAEIDDRLIPYRPLELRVRFGCRISSRASDSAPRSSRGSRSSAASRSRARRSPACRRRRTSPR